MPDTREYEETLTLLKHHLRIASDLAEKLDEAIRDEPSRNGGEPGAAAVQPREIPAAKRDLPLIEQVLGRASVRINEAAVRIIADVAGWEGVGEAIPERPRDGKPPTYVRFAKDGKTFAYVQVRRDHLRIDLPIDPADAEKLRGQPVRVRDVKADNPWKVSLYVRDPDGIEDALQGIARAFEVTFDERAVVPK